ncbi:LysR family transcriptional regulator [Burkholderia sp. BCC0322]|uniref:LysR family transcriptional regulator n=1 Tax=unclassified Burkholderia TaxID=2613784 RepID=UPI001FC7DF75|nr:LysR family transcriptional regulator [Burkholderia sp. BCC0322]
MTGRLPVLSLNRAAVVVLKLDPPSLKSFERVVEDDTIASAAAREHIAAAAVSRRLSKLEDALGTRLLVRTNKGFASTAAGFHLVAMARDVLDHLHNIATRMREFSDGRRGLARLLVNIWAVSTLMSALIRSFVERNPRGHPIEAIPCCGAIGLCRKTTVPKSGNYARPRPC